MSTCAAQAAIARLTLEEKIRPGEGSDDLACYFIAHPQALVELGQVLGRAHGGLTATGLAALAHWMGLNGLRPFSGEDFVLRTDSQGRTCLAMGAATGATLMTAQDQGWVDPDDIDQDALGQVRAAERAWFSTGTLAPVVVVEFQGERRDDPGGARGAGADARVSWDGTRDFLAVAPERRNGLCQMGSCDSTGLVDSESASPTARQWQGPFSMRVRICRPGERLVALRRAVALELALQAGGAVVKAPRL